MIGSLYLSLLIAPTQAADVCPYGVNAHQAPDEALELAADAGIGWVRFDMNWFQFEPAQGSYDWSAADRFVDTADGLGLQVFFTVAYTPSWAVSGGCDDASSDPGSWCKNAHPANSTWWTDFLTAAVERYGDRVKHWGMWNEPNLEDFYRGTREQYTQEILIPGSDAVRAACADCAVLGPELANIRNANWDAEEGICAFGECIYNGWQVSLESILTDAGGSIDIITHHKYEDPADELWSEALDGQFLYSVQYMNGIKEITDTYGQGQPVWLTEFGWESEPWGGYSDGEAAAELEDVFRIREEVIAGTWSGADNQPWEELEALFWYDLVDDPNGYSWGLLSSDLTPKEPYEAYADVIADLGPCGDAGGSPSDTGGADTGEIDTGGAGAGGDDTGGGVDTGAGGDGEDTGGAAGADTDLDGDGRGDDTGEPGEAPGCGCGVGGLTGAWIWGLAVAARRRRA